MNVTQPPQGCIKCGHQDLWDNRATKTNPKSPDWKCKNKACGEAYWLKGGNGATGTHAPTPQPQYSSPPPPMHPAAPLAQYPDPYAPAQPAVRGPSPLDVLFNLHDACLDLAIRQSQKLAASQIGDSPEAVSSRAATLFIAAKDKGIV